MMWNEVERKPPHGFPEAVGKHRGDRDRVRRAVVDVGSWVITLFSVAVLFVCLLIIANAVVGIGS